MKKYKGFSMMELMVVIAIMSILMMIAIPNMGQVFSFTNKNMINTTNKVIISAIDYWVKDNRNPSQRPDNFNSQNSQGKRVFEYISNNEIYNYTNMHIQKNTDNSEYMTFKSDVKDIPIIVEFERGRLVVSPKEEKYKEKNTVVYGVFELNSSKTEIEGYDSKKENGLIVGSIKRSHNVGISSIKKSEVEEYRDVIQIKRHKLK